MKEDDQPRTNDKKPLELTVYRPEDPVFQKLHLCEYLRELYAAVEEENEPSAKK